MRFKDPRAAALAKAHLGFDAAELDPLTQLDAAPAAAELEVIKARVKKTYRAFCLDHHPDRTGGDKEKETLFKSVSAIYSAIEEIRVAPSRPVWRGAQYVIVVVNDTRGSDWGTSNAYTTTMTGV